MEYNTHALKSNRGQKKKIILNVVCTCPSINIFNKICIFLQLHIIIKYQKKIGTMCLTWQRLV